MQRRTENVPAPENKRADFFPACFRVACVFYQQKQTLAVSFMLQFGETIF